MKKTITSIIAAGAIAASTVFTPTPAAANPGAIAAIVIAAVFAGTFVTKAKAAQQPQGTITVKAAKKSKKR